MIDAALTLRGLQIARLSADASGRGFRKEGLLEPASRQEPFARRSPRRRAQCKQAEQQPGETIPQKRYPSINVSIPLVVTVVIVTTLA
jgi:hypothetical protein